MVQLNLVKLNLQTTASIAGATSTDCELRKFKLDSDETVGQALSELLYDCCDYKLYCIPSRKPSHLIDALQSQQFLIHVAHANQ